MDPLFKINPRLSMIYNGTMPSTAFSTPSTVGFSTMKQTLPNGAGVFETPVVAQPTKPVATNPVQTPPVNPGPQQQQGPAPIDYSKYTDPVTGRILTPQEYAESLAKRISGGSIPNYAGDTLTQGPQTTPQLQGRATDLNNQRNDIAVGEADPYNVASRSGIAYSPTELKAIEKAYAGIYDPVLKDVFAKLDAKEKQDEQDRQLKNDLAKMAQQHIYDVELKKTPTASDALLTGGGSGLTYQEGANPVVDAWVDKIGRGEAKLSDISGVKNQGLKNLVIQGLNTVKGRNAKAGGSLDTINNINNLLLNPDLDNISGFLGQTGVTSLFGKAKTAKTDFDQILGAIQLAKAGSIQGQGAVSDYERATLKAAAAAIDRGQSDAEFRQALVKLRGAMTTAAGLEAPVRVTNPATGETVDSTANTEEINDLIAEGNIVTYIEK